jgi:hypothetical protein
MQCYRTTCAGPDKLKVGVDGVWYDCPYEGGIIQPIDFGGELTCPKFGADTVCAGAENDFSWPSVTRIFPHKAKPGTNLTVHGNHFSDNNIVSVKINVECPSFSVISNTELVVTLPSNDAFGSVQQMGLFSRRYSVVVTDDEGKTGYMKDALLIEVTLDGSDVATFFANLGLSPVVTSILSVVIMIILCVGCIFWCCKTWKIMEQDNALRRRNYSKV